LEPGALVFVGQGDHRRARELFEEGLEMSRRLEYKHTIVFHLHAVAALASAQGQSVRSAWLRGAGESLMRDIGTGLGPLERHHYGPCVSAARTLLDEAAWEAAFAGGMAMSTEEVAGYALSEEVAPPPESPPADRRTDGALTDPLTPREMEVAAIGGAGTLELPDSLRALPLRAHD
jgi:hypothetical protein